MLIKQANTNCQKVFPVSGPYAQWSRLISYYGAVVSVDQVNPAPSLFSCKDEQLTMPR
jgi:hypothetical protein|uniref:Uncharacterized protein n=2 Tax=Picea TaxID=3328 RepID=A0A117NG16_PICGL|nr:hypothetical protein ABT39_MTgene1936 [Picea glauca]QHR89922.1 hypothetical protein Q903MT_gene3944 [Picea sitchensis]